MQESVVCVSCKVPTLWLFFNFRLDEHIFREVTSDETDNENALRLTGRRRGPGVPSMIESNPESALWLRLSKETWMWSWGPHHIFYSHRFMVLDVVHTHQLLTCRSVRFVWVAICFFSSSVGYGCCTGEQRRGASVFSWRIKVLNRWKIWRADSPRCAGRATSAWRWWRVWVERRVCSWWSCRRD